MQSVNFFPVQEFYNTDIKKIGARWQKIIECDGNYLHNNVLITMNNNVLVFLNKHLDFLPSKTARMYLVT